MQINGRLEPGQRLPTSVAPERPIQQAWPPDRDFRILSLDGGGIRGIFPAAILAELEQTYTGGRPIGEYFDLIAGTSTGGLLALGLGAGYAATFLRDLYLDRGSEVFPPLPENPLGALRGWWRDKTRHVKHRYDRKALEQLLADTLGNRLLGESRARLCIPAFEGQRSEVFVFKTPHHPACQTDRHERMVNVGLATAAAPTYYRPFEQGGYLLVEGDVWANNPVMLAVIEALVCFDVDRVRIKVLSIGCGDDPYVVSAWQMKLGSLFFWKDAIFAAMRLQSLAATNQARLLLGPSNIVRIDAPTNERKIALDDWRRSASELEPAGIAAVDQNGSLIAHTFLATPAAPYVPIPDIAVTFRP
jgi:predicted acylesterase/phospholipase RssA